MASEGDPNVSAGQVSQLGVGLPNLHDATDGSDLPQAVGHAPEVPRTDQVPDPSAHQTRLAPVIAPEATSAPPVATGPGEADRSPLVTPAPPTQAGPAPTRRATQVLPVAVFGQPIDPTAGYSAGTGTADPRHGDLAPDSIGRAAPPLEPSTYAPIPADNVSPASPEAAPRDPETSQNHRRPLAFGVPAVLKPVPRRPAGPALALVPDMALDWMDADGVSIRAASCRGHMKRHEGELRQDSFALGEHAGYWWVAVADGVGSAAQSHMGAALATAMATTGVHQELADQAGGLLSSGVSKRESLGFLASALHSEAIRKGLQPRDLSTTLLMAAIPAAAAKALSDGTSRGIDVALWQVGDSSFARIRGEDLTILGDTDDSASPLANSAVPALPLDPTAHAWVEHFELGETLALMTDGVSNITGANADYRLALTSLWDGGAPTPARLLEVVDATVKSFDDDRTFVGVRFGPREP